MERVFERFPRWQPEIEQLYQENADFQEICQDYEELLSLLATSTAPLDANLATIDGYRALLNALEAEMIEVLQARFPHVGLPESDQASRNAGKGGDEENHTDPQP